MKIYELENRGMQWFYHWFIYILGGLRHIKQHDEKSVVYMPWFKDWHDYERESLEFFSHDFIFVFDEKDLARYENKEIVRHHGEPLLASDTVHADCFSYLQNKFVVGAVPEVDPTKYIYVTRRDSRLLPQSNGKTVREIVNEDEIIPILNKYNFQIVRLEIIPLKEKIRLFQTSKIIMGVWSGGLTLSFCASPQTTIVDLYTEDWPGDYKHYEVICRSLNIPYRNFNGLTFVNDGCVTNRNMCINIPRFEKFVHSLVAQ